MLCPSSPWSPLTSQATYPHPPSTGQVRCQRRPKGKFKLEYTVRLNNPGRFDLPSTRVEEMYTPETFGRNGATLVSVE